MRRAASSGLVRLSRQASRDLPPPEVLAPAGPAAALAGGADRRQGDPHGRQFGAHLAAALHLQTLTQHLHLTSEQQERQGSSPSSPLDPAAHPHK